VAGQKQGPPPMGPGYPAPPGYGPTSPARPAARGDPAATMLTKLEEAVFGSGQTLSMGLTRSDILFHARADGAAGPGITFEPGQARPVEGTLLLVAIPIELAGSSFDIPHGLTTARAVESSFGNLDWSGGARAAMPKGYIVAEVDLPVSGWDLRLGAVRVYLSYSGKDVLRFAVRDWTTGGWQELPVSPGNRNNFSLSNPGRYVRLPEGVLQFRLENTSTGNPPVLGDLSVACQGWHGAPGSERQ